MDRRSFMKLAAAAGISVVYTPSATGAVRGHSASFISIDEYPHMLDPAAIMAKPGSVSIVHGSRQTGKTSMGLKVCSMKSSLLVNQVLYITNTKYHAKDIEVRTSGKIKPISILDMKDKTPLEIITEFATKTRRGGVIVIDVDYPFTNAIHEHGIDWMQRYREIAVDTGVSIVFIQSQNPGLMTMIEVDNVYYTDGNGFIKSRYNSRTADCDMNSYFDNIHVKDWFTAAKPYSGSIKLV